MVWRGREGGCSCSVGYDRTCGCVGWMVYMVCTDRMVVVDGRFLLIHKTTFCG